MYYYNFLNVEFSFEFFNINTFVEYVFVLKLQFTVHTLYVLE